MRLYNAMMPFNAPLQYPDNVNIPAHGATKYQLVGATGILRDILAFDIN